MSSNFDKKANKLTDCPLCRAGKASCNLNLLLHILRSQRTKLYHVVDDPVQASFPPSSLLARRSQMVQKSPVILKALVLINTVFHYTKTQQFPLNPTGFIIYRKLA